MKFKILLTALLLNTLNLSYAQGIISGLIKDAKTNETIPGVKVMIEGMPKGAFSDLDGKYALSGVDAGTYTLSFKYDTYITKVISDVVVKNGETTTLDVLLEATVLDLGPVEVTYTVNKESNSNVIQMQKNNAGVIDVMSGEQMRKTGDGKASDVLKRVSGASVQDNKFVVIRGLSDRYNFALINGASLPSSESDRKAFSFDLFPSNMLDNLVIMKSGTPELPGEFAGGVIDINTVEPKDKNFQSIQLSGSYNTLTTFKDFAAYDGGSLDFLGLGSSSRSLPSSIPATADFALLTKDDKALLAEQMNFSWASKYKMAMPNGSLQYSLGRKFDFKDAGQLAFVFAYNYQNNYNTNTLIRREFEEQATTVVTKMELNDSVFTRSVINSGMFNIQYKFDTKNKITLKTLASVNSDDKVNIRRGVRELDNDPHQWERSTNIWYTENKLLTTQLIGNHELTKGRLNWNLGFSDVSRDVPNLRRVVYRKYTLEEDDTTQQYAAVVQSNGSIPTAAGNMFWSESNEKIVSARYDYSIPFEKDSNKVELKFGGMHQYRTKDFSARNFGFSQYKPTGSTFNSQLLLLPEDQIFAPENLGLLADGQGGFKLDEVSRVDDSYEASSFLNAGFAMADATVFKKLRIIGGVRLESYYQYFFYVEDGSNEEQNIDTTNIDFLPSLNLVYSLTKRINLRASYYRTVSRPEFRELAPFAFYNFVQDNILSGNPELKRATINNYDLRFEYFPGEGQILSVSGFYKEFNDPIELINRTGTSGAPELYYANVPKARNIGAELEYRLKLGFISKGEKEHILWDNLTFYTNLSLIRSKVDLTDIAGSGGERPLQGQSPYIVNGGIFYEHPEKDWSVSASYNVVGQRIYIVGNVQEPSVWENGRHMIDLQFSKTFAERFELKVNVRDLLAQKLVYFQDLNGNQKFDNEKNPDPVKTNDPDTDNYYQKGPDNVWQEVQFGQTVAVSLKYNFGIERKKEIPEQ